MSAAGELLDTPRDTQVLSCDDTCSAIYCWGSLLLYTADFMPYADTEACT
jgi:hypothetical protein